MGVCDCSVFCCTLLCVRSSISIILMGKRELVVLLNLSSWCLVMVERLFLWGCLRFVLVVFPDHTHLLFTVISCQYTTELNGKIDRKGISYLVRRCTVCIANNRNRNVYICLNTRIFPTSGYARSL